MLARINPSLPVRRRASNPSRRRRNPSYAQATAEVLGAPLAGAAVGAIAGLIIASVAKPERLRYAAGMGAILGVGVVGVMKVDARVHGGR